MIDILPTERETERERERERESEKGLTRYQGIGQSNEADGLERDQERGRGR